MTLIELLALMREHLRVVVIVPVVCAILTLLICFVALPNTYTASVSMYVLTKTTADTNGLTNSDLSASQMLTNDVATLIKSDRVQNDAAQEVKLENLDDYRINVVSQTTTRVVTVNVTGTSPASVAVVANQLAKTTDTVAQEVMDVQSINVIDQASEPESPSGPPRLMYTAISLFASFFIAVGALALIDRADTRVRTAEEAAEMAELPIIGRIPVIRD